MECNHEFSKVTDQTVFRMVEDGDGARHEVSSSEIHECEKCGNKKVVDVDTCEHDYKPDTDSMYMICSLCDRSRFIGARWS